jgi:hypothetical protein
MVSRAYKITVRDKLINAPFLSAAERLDWNDRCSRVRFQYRPLHSCSNDKLLKAALSYFQGNGISLKWIIKG